MEVYKIGEHTFGLDNLFLIEAVKSIQGFDPFLYTLCDETPSFKFCYEDREEAITMDKCIYEFELDDVKSCFGTHKGDNYMLKMKHQNGEELTVWTTLSNIQSSNSSERVIYLNGLLNIQMLRFALWIGYGLMTLHHNTIAIHSSCIVYKGKAVLFLGESGTGKSTHTRLWREHIEEATLLNDDSPILRIENGKVYAYGSAWSGKKHCYRNEKYPLAGIVRLSQAPFNKIKKLSVLHSYAAIHPSCPPEFAYCEHLYDAISKTISEVLISVPVYHLACLPNNEAAKLSHKTIFNDGNP